MSLPNPVIVVPAIQASNLRDEYPIDPELVFSLLSVGTGNYDNVLLHPEDLRYEAREPMRVTPDSIFSVIYGELVDELREELTEKRGEPVPVYLFAYDWRQPLEHTVAKLAAFIQEVLDRTALMKHYHKAWKAKPETRQVNLVGHSMGGLVIAGLLGQPDAKAKVGKVATLGTPYQGSLEALYKVVSGTGNLGWGGVKPSERKAARLTPALYYLLPRFAGAVQNAAGKSIDLFDTANLSKHWQKSVLDSIRKTAKEFFFENATNERADAFFAALLTNAKRYLDAQQTIDMAPEDYLCIVGLGEETRLSLRLAGGSGVSFNLDDEDTGHDPNVEAAEGAELNTGDGTVPAKGAAPEFLAPEHLVCVTPKEYGWSELHERIIGNNVVGFHGMLPQMNLIQRLVIEHFNGKKNKYGGLKARRFPGAPAFKPPFAIKEIN